MRITLSLQTDLNVENVHIGVLGGKLATRLSRKQELVGKFSKWTLYAY